MTMLKLASKLLGEDYSVLTRSSVRAKQKILVICTLLLIPVSIWFVTAVAASTEIFHQSMTIGALAGVAAGILILIVDLAFIRSSNTRKLRNYRFLIVLISCSLGSLALDAVFFKEDVHAALERIQLEQAQENTALQFKLEQNRIDELNEQIAAQKGEVAQFYKEYSNEMNGTTGTGKSGYGPQAKRRESDWRIAKEELDNLQSEKSLLIRSIQEGTETEQKEFQSMAGLLLHIQAIFETVFPPVLDKGTRTGDWTCNYKALVIWLIVFLFIMLLEYSPMKVKSEWDKTDYDEWKEHQEMVNKTKLELNRLEIQRLLKRNQAYSDSDLEALKILKKVS